MPRYAAVLATVALATCTEVGTDPAAVVALVFDALPYPAVVSGDTLRDESGAAAPLVALPLNSDGNPVATAQVQFLALDPGVTISEDGIIVSTDTAGASVRILAQVGGLQSRPLSLFVTARPDSAAQDGTVDTLRYQALDGPGNVSGAITIRVLSNTVTPPAGVRGWFVRYSVEYRGTTLPPNDETVAWFVDESNRRTAIDTTGTDGRAARRLRVVSTALVSDPDSLLVTATVTARGGPLAGTPVVIVVPVRAQ
jgi:hypothetical protein